MVSIKDIAKQAGVSISTVSYALNGNPKVTEATRQKVLAVAEELHYVPNAAARTLKMRETKIIGAFLTSFQGSFYGELLQGMKEEASKRGYDLVICSGRQSHRMLPERLMDGAVILDRQFADDQILQYAKRGHKLVVLDRELDHPGIVQVLLDNKAGGMLAIDYLIRHGHRKIYIVTGPQESYDSKQRLAAAILAIERSGNIKHEVIYGNFDKPSGIAAAKQIAAEFEEPVAVFCLNDEMAIGMYRAFQQTPYRIGEDVHIIGFDHIDITHYLQPKLATIDYSERRWGAVAAEQLIKLIQDEPVENERIYVNLVEADSVTTVK